MGLYLTIPDIVESEELLSVSAAADGVTFSVVMRVSDTAVRLMRAASNGEHLPLVVLTTDTQILALDSVYLTDVSPSAADDPVVQLTLAAEAVRIV
ncbi:MAG: hypothetical protein QOD72_696 [Acidimicrobiaceae bacterium]|jgi:hypothetical protein|nr:hypothetical protein [Acidimicrobiaceae bacterium]